MISFTLAAQLPPVFSPADPGNAQKSPLVKQYLPPVRVVWQSDLSGKYISNAENLLKRGNGQADLNTGQYFTLKSDNHTKPCCSS